MERLLMTIEIAARLSGLLFWLIIATNLASNRFGYQTFGDLASEANLERINLNPREFKTGVALITIEHICIILLAIMLFVAFNQYSLLLALVWLVSRGIEGAMQIFNKRRYWRLLDVARGFATANGVEKETFAESRLRILESKRTNFLIAQVLFAIGTLAYAILFVTYGVIPAWLAWLGVVAAVLYGLGSVLTLRTPAFRAVWNIGGLLILIFEVVLGGWLLFA